MFRIGLHALTASLATLFLVLCGLVVGLFIRLQSGPMDLSPVQAMLESGIEAVLPANWQVSWDRSELAWDAEAKNVVVRLRNAQILDAGLQPVLQIKQARITAHLLHLMAGRWVPRDVWLTGMHLAINLNPALLNPAPMEKSADNAKELNNVLQMVWRDVHRIHVDDTDMLIGIAGQPPIALRRLKVDALRQHRKIQMLVTATRQVYETQTNNNFSLRYDYDLKRQLSKIDVGIQNIFLADILPYLATRPDLKDLAQSDWQVPADMHFQGEEITKNNQSQWEVGFNADIGNGFIAMPAALPYALSVQACTLSGKLMPAVTIKTENCQLQMPGGLMKIAVAAQQQADQWQVQSAVDRADIQDLDYFWPPAIAPGGYRWLKANMQAGIIDQIKVNLTYDPKVASEIASMDGGFALHNVTSKFLKPLPPITGANGAAVLKDDTLTFNINGAQYLDQTVGETRLVMTKLFDDLPMVQIDTELSGPLATLLQTINHAPYYLINYDWLPDKSFSRVTGNYTGKLMMRLPMLADLAMKDIDYDASGNAKEITWGKFWHDLPLRAVQADFQLTPTRFMIKGLMGLGTVLANVDWHQQKGAVQGQQGNATGKIDGQQLAQLGLPLDNYIKGSISWQADLQQSGNGPMQIGLRSDLTPAAIQFSATNVIKTAGQTGRLALEAVFNDRNTQLNNIQLNGPHMQIRGHAQLDENGEVQKLELDPLRLGTRTDARVQATGQAWIIRGQSLDLSPLLKSGHSTQKSKTPHNDYHPAQSYDLQTTQLWLGDTLPIDQPNIQLSRAKNRAWDHVQVTGRVGKDAAPIDLQWAPSGAEQKLTADIADLGLTLQAAGLTDQVVGGQLTAQGSGQAGAELQTEAAVQINDFKIRNMPLLARIVSATSPTGLFNLLKGSGLGFDELKANVKYHKDATTLQQGNMHSSAFGLTFGGVIDHAQNTLDLKGTAVPLYALNHLIAQIPLLGDILTGEDDAVVGASYHAYGQTDDPNVSVNPLSAITPGFIRDLFFANSSDQPEVLEKK